MRRTFRIILCLTVLFGLWNSALASRDTIFTVSGKTIPCNVIEIATNTVKYVDSTEINVSLYMLYKKDILYITFKNGDHAFYNLDKSKESSIKGQGIANQSDELREKQVVNQNIIGFNIINLVHGNVNLSFEHISNSGYVSFRIPVKIGFDNENGTNYLASFYSGRKVIWSTELDVLIYPKGQKKASYVFGLGYEIGELNFFDDNLVSAVTGVNSTSQKKINRYRFNALYVYNGIAITPSKNFTLSILAGIGGKNTFELEQEYSMAMNLSVSVGFRF